MESTTHAPLPAALARAALDLADNMLVVTDRDGTIVYVNEAFTRVTGYGRDEAIGGTPALLRSGVQDDGFYRALWGRILDGERWDGELVNRRRDGTLYTDRMTITPLRGTDGRPTHFVAVKRDVSSHLAALTSGSPSGAAHMDVTGRLVYANARLEQLLGRGFEDLLGLGWTGALDDDDARAVLDAVAATADRGEVVTTVHPRGGGALRVHVAPFGTGDGDQAGVVGTFEDVSREAAAEQRLREREAWTRSILDSLDQPTVVVDADGVVRAVNRAWQDGPGAAGSDPATTGVGTDYLAACRRSAATGDEGASRALEALRSVLDGEQDTVTVDYAVDGPGPTWWELRITPLVADGGGAVLVHTDITARHELAEVLAVRATSDPLTGLRNRAGLAEHAEAAVARAQRRGEELVVLFLDLDGFKAINDTHGHEAGDAVLRASAAKLLGAVRTHDVVARVGGDEFVVLCEGLAPADRPGLVERVRSAVEAPVVLPSGTVTVGASIGVAGAVPNDGTDLDALLSVADARMYADKRRRAATRRDDAGVGQQ